MELRIIGTDLPTRTCGEHTNVHVGIQIGRDPAQLVPSGGTREVFTADLHVVPKGAGFDFRGKAVQGKPAERFVYLTWGDVTIHGYEMFRRTKLILAVIDPATIAAADTPGHHLEATLPLTDPAGLPRCARVVPPDITWTAAPD